ncbi:MAG: ribbon-helix-helix protein, CopG family [Candidatus Helarchaeota archaeon]|nr:ribbon-helix-helix protein, CopG family [Candidatus Helarchaeota archaeon]
MSEKKLKQEKISIGVYPDVLKMIDELADKEHRSRSNMLDVIVREYFRPKIEEKTISPRPLARKD